MLDIRCGDFETSLWRERDVPSMRMGYRDIIAGNQVNTFFHLARKACI